MYIVTMFFEILDAFGRHLTGLSFEIDLAILGREKALA